MLTSLSNRYKRMATIDKIVIPVVILAIIVTAAFFARDQINPLIVAAVIAGFFLVLHFTLVKPSGVAATIVLLVQTVMLGFTSNTYGYAATDYSGLQSDIWLGPIAAVALSYIASWATYKWSTGRWWIKLAVGFFMVDFIGPMIGLIPVGSGFMVSVGASLLLLIPVCLPWKRIFSRMKTEGNILLMNEDLKKDAITSAFKNLLKSIPQLSVVDPKKKELADIIAIKGKTEYHITVLSQDSDIDINHDNIYYHHRNIKDYLYEIAFNASGKRVVPIVINYSDSSSSFVELTLSEKAGRKKKKLIITTPSVLIDILKS